MAAFLGPRFLAPANPGGGGGAAPFPIGMGGGGAGILPFEVIGGGGGAIAFDPMGGGGGGGVTFDPIGGGGGGGTEITFPDFMGGGGGGGGATPCPDVMGGGGGGGGDIISFLVMGGGGGGGGADIGLIGCCGVATLADVMGGDGGGGGGNGAPLGCANNGASCDPSAFLDELGTGGGGGGGGICVAAGARVDGWSVGTGEGCDLDGGDVGVDMSLSGVSKEIFRVDVGFCESMTFNDKVSGDCGSAPCSARDSGSEEGGKSTSKVTCPDTG